MEITPAARRIALRSQRMPKSSRRMPTMSWSVVIGMRPSAGPKIATSSARKIALAPAPSSEERQPRVVPTASTMVSASTHSTSEARNAATKAVLACSQVIASR